VPDTMRCPASSTYTSTSSPRTLTGTRPPRRSARPSATDFAAPGCWALTARGCCAGSPCLKHKKHWNSFQPPFLIDSAELIARVERDGAANINRSEAEEQLKAALVRSAIRTPQGTTGPDRVA